MALMSYLIRDRHSTYYFRRPIPAALRPLMPPPWTGKTAWKRSLGTKEPALAKRTASRLLAECMADFELAERAARGETVRPAAKQWAAMPSLEQIESEVLAGLLADDEAERIEGDGRRQHQTREDRQQWPDLSAVPFGRRGMAEDHHHAYGEGVEELAADYRRALSRSDPAIDDDGC